MSLTLGKGSFQGLGLVDKGLDMCLVQLFLNSQARLDFDERVCKVLAQQLLRSGLTWPLTGTSAAPIWRTTPTPVW